MFGMSDAPPNGSSTHAGALVRSIELRGPAGRLEALLNTGKDDARYAAVVSHPHPLFGGTMHNKVVYHAMKSFQSFGIPVLRFNFRGAGLSEGKHDNGYGEVGDVHAALDWMQKEYERPILFAEFGPQPEVEAVVAQAMPPAELVMVPGANHFFSGKLEFMQQALDRWIKTHYCPAHSAATL
jgi:alpha/beta superfamily hydrolase